MNPINLACDYINELFKNANLSELKWTPYENKYLVSEKSKKLGKHYTTLSNKFKTGIIQKQNMLYLPINLVLGYIEIQKKYITPELSESFSSLNTTYDRALGSMLGLAIGDALGITYEIFPRGSLLVDTVQMVKDQRRQIKQNPPTRMTGNGPWQTFQLEAGDFTDDTSMALCIADSLVANKKLDLTDMMKRFVRWWDTGYNASPIIYDSSKDRWIAKAVGLGGNISKALDRFRHDPSNPIAGGTNPNKDAGNGCIMRMAPIAIYWYNNTQKAMEMARLHSTTTHNVEEAKDACAVMAFIICMAIQGNSKENIFNNLSQVKCNSEIAELVKDNAKWKTKIEDEIISLPGRTLWSLEAALWCLYNTGNANDAILKAIMLGGDADTIGAICGQLAGAIYGISNLREDWITSVKHGKLILQKARDLVPKN